MTRTVAPAHDNPIATTPPIARTGAPAGEYHSALPADRPAPRTQGRRRRTTGSPRPGRRQQGRGRLPLHERRGTGRARPDQGPGPPVGAWQPATRPSRTMSLATAACRGRRARVQRPDHRATVASSSDTSGAGTRRVKVPASVTTSTTWRAEPSGPVAVFVGPEALHRPPWDVQGGSRQTAGCGSRNPLELETAARGEHHAAMGVEGLGVEQVRGLRLLGPSGLELAVHRWRWNSLLACKRGSRPAKKERSPSP